MNDEYADEREKLRSATARKVEAMKPASPSTLAENVRAMHAPLFDLDDACPCGRAIVLEPDGAKCAGCGRIPTAVACKCPPIVRDLVREG